MFPTWILTGMRFIKMVLKDLLLINELIHKLLLASEYVEGEF